MRILGCAALVMALVAGATASELDRQLDWSDHYANAKQGAATEQRPLLVVLENSADPAGKLDLQATGSAEKQLELLKQYKLCRMDVNTPYGKRVAEAFHVTKFPFTAITDKSTRYVTFRSSDAMTADQWTQTLEAKKAGETPVAVATPAEPVRVQSAKAVAWPTFQPAQPAGYCPNCVRAQQYFR